MSFGLRLFIEAVLVLALLVSLARLVPRYSAKFQWKLDDPLQRALSKFARWSLSWLPASAKGVPQRSPEHVPFDVEVQRRQVPQDLQLPPAHVPFDAEAQRQQDPQELQLPPSQALSDAVVVTSWLVRLVLDATTWSDHHPVFAAILVVLWLMVFGVIGGDFGIQDLFWHETPLIQILAGVSVGLLVHLVVLLSECARVDGNSREAAALFQVALVIPTAVVASQAVVWIASEVWEGRASAAFANLGLTFGLLLAVWFAVVIDRGTARYFKLPSRIVLGLLPAVVLLGALLVPTAAVWICMALAAAALASFALRWHPLIRLMVVIASIALVTLANGFRPWKLTYPGLEPFTAPGAQVHLVQQSQIQDAADGDEARNGMPKKYREATSDEVALDAWLRQRKNGGDEPSGIKYKLVVVAVSGGGITSAVWTALNLKRIEEVIPDFPRHVRLVTGASGGMLGAAGYVTSIRPSPSTNRKAELDALVRGLAGDSLTPVVRQMILWDLPSILLPFNVAHDRGRELESVWVRDLPCGPDGVNLGSPFHCLRTGEMEGWRPSLVFSPMLVEESLPLLVSNLDLNLGDHSRYQFFRLFPCNPLPLSTAVRMNAAFPFVSPAPNLPTEPPRRVVNAGYYDNFGIVIACAWLRKHREWLSENTSGIILLQIRAYPSTEDAPVGGWFAALGNAMQWLTTPVEAYTRANRENMIKRNYQLISDMRALFVRNTPSLPFDEIVLECPETVPLSWYMKPSDLERLVSWTRFGDPFLHAIRGGAIRPDGQTKLDNFEFHYYENLLRISSLLGGSLYGAGASEH